MQYSKYIGHEGQLSGVEEYRLVGGKGDGMRLMQVRNGQGLECTISPDRGADISRVTFMGRNLSFFGPCGYVAPAFYDRTGTNWLKSFTAGFLTTCGLTNVGGPCEDEINELGLHGTIANIPAEHAWWHREQDALVIEAEMKDTWQFGRMLIMNRKIEISTVDNTLTLTDTVENHGDTPSPLMLLYHMNMGYPLLSEATELVIPSDNVSGRTENATQDIANHLQVCSPTAGYVEQCFFHEFQNEGKAKIFNPEIGLGLVISFDPEVLPCFTQWKMMGEHTYVMGLEPGNTYPMGQTDAKADGTLAYLAPGESKQFQFTVRFYTCKEAWDKA